MNIPNWNQKIHEIRLSRLGGRRALFAEFSRLGQFVAAGAAGREGRLYRTYGTHGETPQLQEITMPEIAWEAATFRPELQLAETSGSQPWATELALASGNRVLRFVLETAPRQVLLLPELSMPGAHCLSYSLDGQFLVAGGCEGHLKVWDLGSNQAEEHYSAHVADRSLTAVAVSPLRDEVFFATADGECYRHSGGNGPPEPMRAHHKGHYGLPEDWECYCMCATQAAPFVAFGGTGNIAWLYHAETRELVPVKTDLGGFIRKVACPTKDRLALFGEHGVEFWSLPRLQRLGSLWGPPDMRVLAARQFCSTWYLVLS